MAKPKHTPTPWVESDSQPHFVFCDAGGVIDVNRPVCMSTANAKGRANAAFIVRACNAHEMLLAALKLARTVIEEERKSFIERIKLSAEADEEAEAIIADYDETLAFIEDAFSVARGEG